MVFQRSTTMEPLSPSDRLFHLTPTLQNKWLLKRLARRIRAVENAMDIHHVITLENISALPGLQGQHWSSRIYQCFTDANLPHCYILEITTSDHFNDVPKSVDISVITDRVKTHTYYTLLHYFAYERKDVNVILH